MLLLISFLFCLSLTRLYIVLCGGRFARFIAFDSGCGKFHQKLYTIIIPMLMEKGRDVVGIRNHLLKMDYESFEILYLCEDVDISLIGYINSLNLHNFERVVQVPRFPPFTKPKACNYGLEFAKGDYIVIYDVEDRPHHMQLRIASRILQSKNCSCVQFPLEFISDGTTLSLWQRIDYLIWYKRLLPVLSHFKMPIPLGGTSNHFKTSMLRKIGGWNSYNVTEDAELGLRMFQAEIGVEYICGYETKEVAVKNIINLVRQRVRWSKGHVITAMSFLKNNFGSIVECISVFFVLMSTQVCYILYTLLTVTSGFYQNEILLVSLIFSVTLFTVYPLFLLVSFSELRSRQNIYATILIPFYYILYFIPIVISLIECIFKPSVWYKTKR